MKEKCFKVLVIVAMALYLADRMSAPVIAYAFGEGMGQASEKAGRNSLPESGETIFSEEEYGSESGNTAVQQFRTVDQQDMTSAEAFARETSGIVICGLLCAVSGFYIRKKSSMKK